MIESTDTPSQSLTRLGKIWYALTTRKRIQQQKMIIRAEALETLRFLGDSVVLAFSSQSSIMDTEDLPSHALLFSPLSHEKISDDCGPGSHAGSM